MASLRSPASSKDTILGRDDIKMLIAQGRKIVIVNNRVLKVDAWLPYHPGGEKAILHMVGRDGTNEVTAFHSAETLQVMQRYQIGRVQGQWRDFVPPIQGGVFREEKEQNSMQMELVDNVEESGSESSRSASLSPVFDPAESDLSGLRRRKGSDAGASDTSATSLSSMGLDDDQDSGKDVSKLAGAERTRKELERDLALYPSLDASTQADINVKFRQLDARLRAQGLYDCNYYAYGIETIRYTLLGLLAFTFLRLGWYSVSAVFLGMLWHQLVFTVHDAGHMGITHNFYIDSCIGIFIADFIGGLSCCWWKQNHNVHHIVTNSTEHDPDIQHMPFFAISHRFFDSLRSTYYDRIMTFDPFAKFVLQYQHYLYYPILSFGRFNLYVLSWQYILLGQGPRKGPAKSFRWLEFIGQVFFWYWFGYLTVYKSIPTASQRVLFVLLSHAITMPVHAQITLSHFAMSTADLGVAESFPQRMLRTTMDIACPPWLDFFHGGLQFQAVHHLFPRMPRHNLREAQKQVMEFCEDVGIPFAIYGFVEGNEKVIGQLGDIAQQARILAECQRSMTLHDMTGAH